MDEYNNMNPDPNGSPEPQQPDYASQYNQPQQPDYANQDNQQPQQPDYANQYNQQPQQPDYNAQYNQQPDYGVQQQYAQPNAQQYAQPNAQQYTQVPNYNVKSQLDEIDPNGNTRRANIFINRGFIFGIISISVAVIAFINLFIIGIAAISVATVGLVFGIFGLVNSAKAKKYLTQSDRKSTLGLVFSIIGICLFLIVVILIL